MKTVYKIAFAALLAVLPFPAQALDVNKNLPVIQEKLDTVRSLSARFKQTAQDGTVATGNFYLSRPGKLRFEYDPPATDFIVADGVFIYFYDGQIKEQTNAPIGKTLADFILRDHLNLTGDITATSLTRKNGVTSLKLVQAADKNAGSITLRLTLDPVELKGWRVTDPYGQTTDIELTEIKTNPKLKRSLFNYLSPELKKPVYN